jgi:hypothetical protein
MARRIMLTYFDQNINHDMGQCWILKERFLYMVGYKEIDLYIKK